MSLMEHLQSWVDMGGKTSFPSSFERLLLDSQEGGIPCCWHTLVTLAQMPCVEKLKLDFMSSSPSLLQHRLDSPNPRDLSEPDPPKIGHQYVRQIGLSSVSTEMAFCGSSDWYRPHFHSRFLKGRVSLWKAVKHAKCEQSALSLNLPCSEHRMKTSLGFVMAFWFWWSIEKGSFNSCILFTIAHGLPEIPWLSMKSILNRARYSLVWGKKWPSADKKRNFFCCRLNHRNSLS